MNIQLLPGVNSAGSGLAAERARMEVIAQNIANANIAKGLDGQPYQRQVAVFESYLQQQQGTGNNQFGAQGVRLSRIEKDTRPPRELYQPGHPDADPDGIIRIPDISVHEEMADLIVASRAFEANLAVVKNARQMAIQTLSIGKR